MLKAYAQDADQRLQLSLHAAAAITAVITAAALLLDARTDPAAALVCWLSLGLMAWTLVDLRIAGSLRRMSEAGVGVWFVVATMLTYELGGLAYLIPAGLLGAAAGLPRIPRDLRSGGMGLVRGATVVLTLFLSLSFVGIVFTPVSLVFLTYWAWTRPSPEARFGYGVVAGMAAVYTGAVGLASREYPHLLLGVVAPVMALGYLAFRVAQGRPPVARLRNAQAIGGMVTGALVVVAIFNVVTGGRS